MIRRLWRRLTKADRREVSDRAWVRDFQASHPGVCAICSYARWAQSMGFRAAFDPVEAHRCIEENKYPPYRDAYWRKP